MAHQDMMDTAIYKHNQANNRRMQMTRMMIKLNKAVLKLKEKYLSHGISYYIIDCELIRIADEFEMLRDRNSDVVDIAYDVTSNDYPDMESRVRAAMIATVAMVDFADDISNVYERTCKRVNKIRKTCEKHYNAHLTRDDVNRN